MILFLLLVKLSLQLSSAPSCVVKLDQDETRDCSESSWSNVTCHSTRNSKSFINHDTVLCNEITINVAVNPTKYSQLVLSISNNVYSSNILEVHFQSQFKEYNSHRGYLKFDLSTDKNRTFPPIQTSTVRLVLRGQRQFGLWEQSIDSTLDFDLDFAPVLQTSCPAECKNCCKDSNFKCYSDNQKCDGIWDCPNGEDEVGCGKCKETEIACPGRLFYEDSKCLPMSYVCDGVKDCNCPDHEKCSLDNGWEERQCSTCKPGGFLCKVSNMCIPERLRCNLEADCPDGEDERNCPIEDKRKVLTAAIVGSLGCGVLFVIALGCTRRLFHVQNSSSCSRTRRNFQNLANILQVREAPPTYEAAMGIECFGTRQSRSRPWRLTRHGLRRDSRRRRRRVGDNAPEEEPSTMEVPPLTQASSEGITQVQINSVNPSDSLDSFDSINVIPVDQNTSCTQVVAPETFNIASPTSGQDHPEEVIEPETEDRKSISSNLQ